MTPLLLYSVVDIVCPCLLALPAETDLDTAQILTSVPHRSIHRQQLATKDLEVTELLVYSSLGTHLPIPDTNSTAPAGSKHNQRASNASTGAPIAGSRIEIQSSQCHILDPLLEGRLRQQHAELVRRQQIIARLVEVSEEARGETERVKSALDSLKKVSHHLAFPGAENAIQSVVSNIPCH